MVSKRRLRGIVPAFGLALIASLALGAIGVASASATTQHWYVGGTKLAEGTPTDTAMTGTSEKWVIRWWWLSAPTEVNCTSLSGTNEVENKLGGGIGFLTGKESNPTFTFSGCAFVKPLSARLYCEIPGGKISVYAYGETTEFSAQPSVKFNGVAGTLFEFKAIGTKCPPALKESNFRFTGSFIGISKSATSSLEVTEASSANLIAGAQQATLIGSTKLETSTGKTVTVAP